MTDHDYEYDDSDLLTETDAPAESEAEADADAEPEAQPAETLLPPVNPIPAWPPQVDLPPASAELRAAPEDDPRTARPTSPPAPNSGHWYALPGTWTPPQTSGEEALPDGRRVRRSSTRDRVRRRKIRRQQGVPDNWAWVTIGSALVGVVFVMVIAVFALIRTATSSSGAMATSVPGEPTSIFYGEQGGLLGGQSLVIQPWDGQERFTVLVMGMDRRPGETGTAYLTDTIILISLDPATRRVGVLSIPRDLQVEVPDFGVQPVNTVYRLGELDGTGEGAHLAMTTLQYNLGIPINDFMAVDFTTFITMVDLIGGVDVEVKQTIDDPEYPDMNFGYDPFYLQAGWQHLDGTTALKYARSRHQTDDIDRAGRQQQVLYAVRDKVISKDMLPELAANAYTLWAELKDGIHTSLSIDRILELAWYVKDVPRQNIVSGVIGWDYIIAENWNGRPIIRPNRERIPDLLTEIFGPGYDQVSAES